MNEIQLNELITRAEKLIAREMPVTLTSNHNTETVNCKFMEIGNSYFIGEQDSSNGWQVDGILEAPDGHVLPPRNRYQKQPNKVTFYNLSQR